MSLLNNLFRGLFLSAARESHLPDAFATTLHDAMRIANPKFARTEIDFVGSPFENAILREVTYEGPADLREQLRQIDAMGQSGGRLHAMLLLDEALKCDWTSLLAKDSIGHRLVIVRSSRPLPGLLSAADLALLAPKLGWLQIRVGSDLREELSYVLESSDREDRVLVLRPSGSRHEPRIM